MSNGVESPEAAALKCAPLLRHMRDFIVNNPDKGAEIVKKVGCIYQFDIVPKKGEKPVSFTVDLKNGNGSMKEGVPEPKADAQITLLQDDFTKLVTGKLNPQMAFMQGKMKIKGNIKAATKFTPDLFPKPANL